MIKNINLILIMFSFNINAKYLYLLNFLSFFCVLLLLVIDVYRVVDARLLP